MPNTGGHCGAKGTHWFYSRSNNHNIYGGTCKSKKFGDVPGFVWGRRCYFEYGHRLLHSCRWNWVGVMNGKSYYSNSYYCNIFGGYQKHFSRPLFYCVGHYRGWLIPGKLDQASGTCWFLNRHSRCFSKIVAY